jgi:nucleoside-diphosphate-sugar epimerase
VSSLNSDDLTMATSIVTGGAGFVGSHLVDALAKRGDGVIVLDDLRTGRLGNLEGAIASGRVAFVYADVGVDGSALLRDIIASSGVKKVDFIFHFASAVAPRPPLSGDGLTAALVDVAVQDRTRLVYISSAPADRDRVLVDDANGLRDDGEAAVASAICERRLDGRIIRISGCYGPRIADRDDPFLAALLGAARDRRPAVLEEGLVESRPMTYVHDAIEQVLAVATRSESALRPVTIVGKDKRSVGEIARALSKAAGLDVTVEYAAQTQTQTPIAGQRPAPAVTDQPPFAWATPTSLDDGLRATYDWFAKESQLFV